ncbi:MAG: VWA domain-containing protein [Bacteroidales bacterium]|nr:VWA domain-containing protein [Bacteroidales bacterium]
MKFSFPKYKSAILLLFLPVCLFAQTNKQTADRQQNNEKTRILFVVDCSHNMNEKWQSDTKIRITQVLLSNIIDSLAGYDNVECALRVFGNEKDYTSADCDDTHLLVPFYRLNDDNIKAKLKALIPKGTSAVAKSLEKSAEDFPKDKSSRNIVVMIVDNIDKCDGDINQISKSMQQSGKYIKPFIIGISKGMKKNYDACGTYYEAKGEIDFSKALNMIVKQALHNTTVQVNLLNNKQEITETDIPLMFYDNESGQLRYSFVHTFNSSGQSDTLQIDPLIKYDVVAMTIPPVEKKNVSFEAGGHSVLNLPTPQGTLYVKYVNNAKTFSPKIYPIAVKKISNNEVINVQPLNTKTKYLTGLYNLEVMTLPRLIIDSVEVSQSSTTTIEIPETGVARIEKQKSDITGSIFVVKDGKTQWIKDIEEAAAKETLDLLPGEYLIVAKSKSSLHSAQTITQEFKIESNKTTNISLVVKTK